MSNYDIVILGAGIAGCATAYYLSEQAPALNIALLDRQSPLALTSACSGENFREFWPQPGLNTLASDSIQLMRELLELHGKDAFKLDFSGYEFISHETSGGPFGNTHITTDAFEELNATKELLQQKPYLDADVKRIIRASNAGQMDVHGLGMLLLKQARSNGVKLLQHSLTQLDEGSDGVQLTLDNKTQIHGSKLVLASGPFLPVHLDQLGMQLPIENVRQQKFVMPDPLQIIPRDMPFTIYADPQQLHWSDDEKALLQEHEEYAYLLQPFPAGLHIKPEGQAQIKLGWAYNRTPETPQWQAPTLDQFAEIVLRGASRFIPALRQYLDQDLPATIDFAGYYTRTPENLPLIGQVSDKTYCIGALAGYGTMCACGGGKLLTAIVLGQDVPSYAEQLAPNRYNNAALMGKLKNTGNDGQL